MHLRNFARCFAAAKPPTSTRVPLRKLKLHLHSCEPPCEITSKLRIKLQITFKLRNHLQVAKSQIQLAKSKFKLAKWIIQRVNHLAKSTCAISDICNRLMVAVARGYSGMWTGIEDEEDGIVAMDGDGSNSVWWLRHLVGIVECGLSSEMKTMELWQWMEMATIACGYLQRSKKVLPILD
uniref:Uncharacterized protein n=1 Tax=Vitis vinifera TaxID=29760 RepID=A5AKM4_VITVI|nr:hypothetical protein VITISV_008150 [Vitis vinifera]